MPILPYESDIHPDTLLESPPTDAKWWAACTLARREKVFMQGLRKLDVPFYGPLIKKTTLFGRRLRTAFVPLFPGYVFLCGNDAQRLEAFRTQCVVRILEVPDASGLINDLRQIHQLVASDAHLFPEARLVPPRMKERIQSGRFAGLEGAVIKRRGKETLLVAVNFLQQGVSVALEETAVPSIESYVASVKSPFFHKSGCKAATTMLEENLVHYATQDEAIAAEKKPCAGCIP